MPHCSNCDSPIPETATVLALEENPALEQYGEPFFFCPGYTEENGCPDQHGRENDPAEWRTR